jgi:hypothetical protein
MHMFTFLLDDVGIPLNYRHMEGFGVHTFTLLTRDGKVRVRGDRGGGGDETRGVGLAARPRLVLTPTHPTPRPPEQTPSLRPPLSSSIGSRPRA